MQAQPPFYGGKCRPCIHVEQNQNNEGDADARRPQKQFPTNAMQQTSEQNENEEMRCGKDRIGPQHLLTGSRRSLDINNKSFGYRKSN